MKREEFRARLSLAPMVCDGGMGTNLYSKGVMVHHCFDELNMENPEIVRSVHLEYLSVGVDMLETNTYGANRFKLGPHGYGHKAHEVNEKGALIAKDAAKSINVSVLVAGAVGPIGKPIAPVGTVSQEDSFNAFVEQVSGLVDGGVDVIILETFSDLREIELAISAVRSVTTTLPIIAQMTFGDDGSTPLGAKPENVARKLSNLEIDVIGANCSVGPELLLSVVERLAKSTKLPLSVQPNAGLPELVEGRVLYLSSPDYMAHYTKLFLESGAGIVGGCCGTTPAHIGAMVGVVRSLGLPQVSIEMDLAEEKHLEQTPVKRSEKSRLAKSLGRKFVMSVHMDPPVGADPGLFIEKAQWLKEREVDFLNIGNGSRAGARMSALSFAVLLEQSVGVETVLHYQCRDRNLVGIQSDLLGAQALGLKNIVAVTGEPSTIGYLPYAKTVFDIDSIGLVRVLSRLNRGLDVAANPLGPVLPFHIGVGFNPSVRDFEAEMRRFELKVKWGAEYCLTQPVFEPKNLETLLKAARSFEIPVIVGILPLVSARNAEFLHNEVPGISIPNKIREQLLNAASHKKAEQIGIGIARDTLRAAYDLADGAYVIPPSKRFELVVEVIEDL